MFLIKRIQIVTDFIKLNLANIINLNNKPYIGYNEEKLRTQICLQPNNFSEYSYGIKYST